MGQDYALANTVVETGVLDFLDSLPAYNSTPDNWGRLDQIRQFLLSQSYMSFVVGFPFGDTTNQLTLTSLATKEGSIQIPPKSYLLGISADAVVAATQARAYNFTFSIADKGSGLGITERGFIFASSLSGYGADASSPADTPQGPYWLDSPLVVTNPGQVGFSLTNQTEDSLIIQVAMHFAIPLTNNSLNTPHIKPVV